ncbi:hypothetical protein Btru_072684, partial [Bulinus truncatus]
KSTEDLLKEMLLNDFLSVVNSADMNETLHGHNYTIFTPTDEAFRTLPPGYLKALSKPDIQQLVKYHMVSGKYTGEDLVGEQRLETFSPLAVKLYIKVNRKGVTVDKATVDSDTRECKDSIIHKVDHVLIPNQKSLIEELTADKDMTEFTKMLHKSGMSEMLLPSGSYTVMAPTNKALSLIDEKHLQKIKDDPVRLKKFVHRHILSTMVLKCTIPQPGILSIRAMNLDQTEFEFHLRTKRLHINKHAVVVSDDILTSNGVLYKIDHVLPCTCEPALRTNHGIYISDHRYRRRY